jgi:hypothetical protein
MIRKFTGYAMAAICFLLMLPVLFIACIIIMELIGFIPPSPKIGLIQYVCATFLLMCPLIDRFALSRTIRRFEAFANRRTLKEHEATLGMS